LITLSLAMGCSGSISGVSGDNGVGAGGNETPRGTPDAASAATTGAGGSKPLVDTGPDVPSSGSTNRDGAAVSVDATPRAIDAPFDAIPLSCETPFPTAASVKNVPSTIKVSGVYDGGMARFVGTGDLGTSGQGEDQGPLFQLSDGATLRNVILGNPAADGVHCSGNCTLENVWWEDVGEDAATLQGSSSSQVMLIDGGGAMHAADKVFQHNGPGTMIIQNFFVEDFGKLYRSCGNCDNQFTRHAVIQNIVAIAPGSALAGVNANYNDTATLSHLTLCDKSKKITVCQRYTGNDTGAEPPLLGSGADGTNCIYSSADVTWVTQ
jgi:hypothetical protein